jgi:4-amino-4-deoxy-L-arabinose transferase-like glycosyltransferase
MLSTPQTVVEWSPEILAEKGVASLSVAIKSDAVKTQLESAETSSTNHDQNARPDLLACAALIVVCTFLYFVGLGDFPFIDPSEAYYVEACREMLQLGDYITPHLNYQIYFSKPILNFWLIAASYKMFGLSEFSARLPFAILSTALVLANYWFGKRLLSQRAGFIAGFICATSPLLLLVSRKSSIDIVFTFFLNIAVFATALTIARKSKWAWLAIYGALGFGVLAKGPATLILYGAGMFAFLVVSRPSFSNLKNWILALKPLAGSAIFLAVVLPWHIAVSMATDGLFLKVFFWYENLARFQGRTNFGTVRYWFYLSVLGYGFFPWITLLIPAMWKAIVGDKSTVGDAETPSYGATNTPAGSVFTSLLQLASRVRKRAADDDQARALILIASWSLTTFAFFSISKTQLATYILPFIAPASLLVAALLDKWMEKGYKNLDRPARFWLWLTTWVFAIAGVAALPGSIFFAAKYTDASLVVRALVVAIGVVFAIGGVRQLMTLRKGQMETSAKWLAGTTAIALAIGTPIAFDLAVNKTQGNLRAISLEAGKSPDKIAMYGNFMPSSMYYARKPVDTFFHGHQLLPVKPAPKGKENQYPHVQQAILVRDSELEALKATAPCPLVTVKKIGNWGWYRTPGYELESVKTLEDTFKDPVAFKIIVNGESQTGPLTVPYAAGKLYEQFSR